LQAKPYWPLAGYYAYLDTGVYDSLSFDELGLLFTDENGSLHYTSSDGRPTEPVTHFAFAWSTIYQDSDIETCTLIYDDSLDRLKKRKQACVLPELITLLFHQRNSPAYPRAVDLLNELIRHLSAFPVPWGLKLIAECRGIAPAWFEQPLSSARTAQAKDFRAWFPSWWARCESAVAVCATEP
jgi:hypothetical protein